MNEKPEIRPVVGYEGLYVVSSAGEVFNARTGRRISMRPKPDGYVVLQLWKDNKNRCVRIHRLVAEAFIGPIPEGKEVNHKDGDKGRNSVENLEYVTRSQNMTHAMDNGMYPIGDTHPCSRLTAKSVEEIRYRFSGGERCSDLAREFGVSCSAVNQAVKGGAWKRVPGPTVSSVPRNGIGVYRNGKRWVARIRLNRKAHTVGYFATFDEAMQARKEALARIEVRGGPQDSVAELVVA